MLKVGHLPRLWGKKKRLISESLSLRYGRDCELFTVVPLITIPPSLPLRREGQAGGAQKKRLISESLSGGMDGSLILQSYDLY